MADAATRAALDALLAGQAKAAEQYDVLMARLGQLEEAQRQQIAAIAALAGSLGTLCEAVDRLSNAATAEPKKKGRDLAMALRKLAKVVAEGNVMIGRAALAAEALPDVVETIALRAVVMAQGGGVDPK